MVQQAEEVWIVIDALDECQTRKEHSRRGLLSWIQSLQDSQGQVNVHLLLTSRPEQDIEAAIRGSTQDQNIILIGNDLIQEDINAYIYARVREPGELSERWHTRPTIQAEIEAALINKADGMYVVSYRAISVTNADLGFVGPRVNSMSLKNILDPKKFEQRS
jgi:hypothetical protein